MEETTEEYYSDLTVYSETIAHMLSNQQYKNTYMYYGYVISACTPVAKNFQAPAGVTFIRDHYVLYINPPLFDKFSLPERLGILKHEMLHVMNGHISRVEDRDFRKFNYATDCAINQLIDRDHLPDGVIYPDTLPTSHKKVPKMLSAEQYYDMIDDDQLPDDPNGSGSGAGLDDHSVWEEATGDADLQKDVTKDMLEKALENTQKARGHIPSNVADCIELHSRKNEFNWKQMLRNLVSNKRANSRSTMMRSSRRFPKREDIKGKTKDRTFELAVICDVSGSMSNLALTQTLPEIHHICKLTNTPVKLVQVDTQPYPPEELKKTTSTFSRKAGGGTNLSPAIDTLKEYNVAFSALVVITDGWLSETDVQAFVEIRKPVIFLIEPEGEIMTKMTEGMCKAVKMAKRKEP